MPSPSERFKNMKQLVRKLSKGQPSKTSGAKDSKASDIALLEDVSPSTEQSSAKQSGKGGDVTGLKIPFVKNSKGTRVAFTLLLVRPWVLVAGFWLFSLLGAAVALEGMISPKKLTQALPQATEVTPVATSSLINVEQISDDIVADDSVVKSEAESSSGAEAENSEAVQVEATDGRNFPVRTLGVLVGTCAAGCLVMSRRRAMMRMAAARSRSRNRRGRPGIKPVPNALAHKQSPVRKKVKSVGATKLATKTGATGLGGVKQPSKAKKRRQRNKRVVAQPAVARTSGNRPLVSRSTAKKSVPPSSARPRPVKRKSSRTANRRQSVVSVVPANASHALDWTNGSLAHDMDVRPQRTASM